MGGTSYNVLCADDYRLLSGRDCARADRDEQADKKARRAAAANVQRGRGEWSKK